jgi:hypothetical protein
MTYLNDYENVLDDLLKLKNDTVKSPHVPIDFYLNDAETLFEWAIDDKGELLEAGLDLIYIKDLPNRIGALRQAQALWYKASGIKEVALMAWKIEEPLAYEMLREALSVFRFVFRNIPDKLQQVLYIILRFGENDFVSDFSTLVKLGRENIFLIKKYEINLSILNSLNNKAQTFEALLEEANGANQEDSQALIMRNKAFTHLKHAVDEIKAYGRFIFKDDETRLKGYLTGCSY